MRIKSRIWVSIAASLAVSALIALFVFSVLRELNEDRSQNMRYTEVINKAFALNILIDNVKTEPSQRNMQQAKDVHRTLNKLLADEVSHDVREEALLMQIRRNSQQIGPFLDQFLVHREAPSGALETERRNMLASQLWIKVRFISDDTHRLMEINQSRMVAAQHKTGTTVLVLIVAVILTNSAIFFVSSRSIVQNLERLSEGVGHISSGDLTHRLPAVGKNEFADLARAFNAMAASLQDSYDRLGRYMQELERSNRELQDFTFVATHDLQEPLRKIQTFSERVRNESGVGLNERSLDFLDRVMNAAKRMHSLMEALLDYSCVSKSQDPYQPTDLTRVAREVMEDLSVRVIETNGRVDIGNLPTIEADPTQMRQLFQNLMSNALKYHRPGVPPHIQVRSRQVHDPDNSRELCEISVADNGIGFDEQYLEKIFTPFQRLHGRKEYEGAGIGLTICRRIAERHGGAITAMSRQGKGSTFIITLPVKHEGPGLDANDQAFQPLKMFTKEDRVKERLP